MQPHETHIARHQQTLARRDAARQAIEACDYLLARPCINSESIFAIDSKDPVAVTHLHVFVASLDRSLGPNGSFFAIDSIGEALVIRKTKMKGDVFMTGERAKKAIESERRFQAKRAEAWSAEVDRAAVLYGLPTELAHSIPVIN